MLKSAPAAMAVPLVLASAPAAAPAPMAAGPSASRPPTAPASAAPPAVAPSRARRFSPLRSFSCMIEIPFFTGSRNWCFRLGPCIRMPFRDRAELGRRTGRELLTAFHLLDDHRAAVLGFVEHLAVQAVDALVRVDLARRVDGLHRALDGAGLTGVAAFMIALQPAEPAEARRDRQRGAQRAEIAALEPLAE